MEGEGRPENSGPETLLELPRQGEAIRRYFFVEKKRPEGRKMAFALAAGFVWESAEKYSGVRAGDKHGQRDHDHPPAEQ